MDQILLSDIQDYFEYIFKKHETMTEGHPIRIYVNKIENLIILQIKIGYYLELLMCKEKVLYTFVSSKSFGQLLGISPKKFMFLKIFNLEFLHIEIWFTDKIIYC